MEKALEILKEILDMQDMSYKVENKVLEAIAELEEAMKPKTCEGCKYQNIDIDRCDFCKRYYSDQYEPKANQ